MGNTCYSVSQPTHPNEERITGEVKLPQLEALLPSELAPKKSALVLSERPTAISPEDLEVEIDPQETLKLRGNYLVGAPQLEETIKQMWTSLQSFHPSYQSKEPYRDPFVFEDTKEIYYGQWGNGVPDGRGFLYSPHSRLFEGSWKEGMKCGRARIIFSDGHLFQGVFFEGKLQGEFTYTSPKLSFKGSYKGNKLNGTISQQTERYSFVGTVKNGQRQKGVLKWLSNSYSGAFDEDGRYHGEGTLKTDVGTYTGEFQNGLKHGKGKFEWKSGLVYEGIYQQNRKHGFGTLFLADGEISYEGHWQNDLPHGRGHTVIGKQAQPDADWQEGLEANEIAYWQRPSIRQ